MRCSGAFPGHRISGNGFCPVRGRSAESIFLRLFFAVSFLLSELLLQWYLIVSSCLYDAQDFVIGWNV